MALLNVYSAIQEWCDGGPTPDKEEVREAFEMLVTLHGGGEPTDASLEPLAPNVVTFDHRFKDPAFVKAQEVQIIQDAIKRGRA